MNTPENWNDLCRRLSLMFGITVDLNGVLFLVGMRERGFSFQKFAKEEKLNLIHLGCCTLYKEMGLVDSIGEDKDGWPLFRQKVLARPLPEARKLKTLQDCAIGYFKRVFEVEDPLLP